jgi:uncharacterized Ntn-hydrolase superfamily protein
MNNSFSQHTFSIVAIDSAVQEVGSAAASFVGGAPRSLINAAFSVHPGKGAIHTQAQYNEQNQILANQLMDAGLSPQAIIDSVVAADSEGDPSFRQYIIIDFVNGGRTAAYTGVSCFDYANHILSKNYAIAGNTLYGQDVLYNMQSSFLNTSGSLADKLMAALQGGKEAGGDKRGEPYGLSSLVATMRIAKPFNSKDSLYLDLFVAYGTTGWNLLQDPIDSLQILYNKWKEGQTYVIDNVHEIPDYYCLFQNYPNPFNPSTKISYSILRSDYVNLKIFDILGKEVQTLVDKFQDAGEYTVHFNAETLSSSIYFYKLRVGNIFTETKKMLLMR